MNNKIKGAFFVTNTYDLCKEVIESDKVVAIYNDYFNALPKIFFESIEGVKKKYIAKNPFDYQTQCIVNALCLIIRHNALTMYLIIINAKEKSADILKWHVVLVNH